MANTKKATAPKKAAPAKKAAPKKAASATRAIKLGGGKSVPTKGG